MPKIELHATGNCNVTNDAESFVVRVEYIERLVESTPDAVNFHGWIAGRSVQIKGLNSDKRNVKKLVRWLRLRCLKVPKGRSESMVMKIVSASRILPSPIGGSRLRSRQVGI